MSDTFSASSEPEVDLTSCDREPIQFLGNVQHFGCLIAVSSDWMIAHASVNCSELLGLEAETLVGARFADFFPPHIVHDLRSGLQSLYNADSMVRIFGADLFGDGRLFDISLHRTGRTLVFEFEPKDNRPGSRADASAVQALIPRLRLKRDMASFLAEAARCMSALIDVSRVMIYRFEEDGSGTVVAETLRGAGQPYLGLRYPASDIPKQARALYERSPLRIIADVRAEVSPIVPPQSAEGAPLDLSLAVTRAVSPMHIEYLRNMGVAASMSVSILRRGKLWGLIACHNNAPLKLDFEARSAVELFGQLFNYELAQLETEEELEAAQSARALHDMLITQASSGAALREVFASFSDELSHVIPFDGMAVYSDGQYAAEGAAPTQDEFMGLVRFLNTAQTSEVLAIDQLALRYPAAEAFSDRVAGLLAVPISRTPRDYLVLFRREVARSVTWAGNPEKPVELGPNGVRLTPRKSFDAWTEVMRGTSAPWRASERRTAEALRVALLEVVLKLTEEAGEARKRGQEQQDLLIAELNHRVRNILNLIRGLVAQSKGGSASLEDYSQVLDHRIHSLARAHDQLTQRAWGWVSLRGLVETEVNAFLSQKATRVRMVGHEIDLSPTAFTTLALVVHELVTNSAKYGALSDSLGEVTLTSRINRDGSATLIWSERNGPPVQAPSRRGFGTTIIEKSIPFELRGKASVSYRMHGLEAEFVLPSVHVTEGQAPEVDDTPEPEQDIEGALVSGDAMVVEDNMIIAMDTQEMILSFGARDVHVFGGAAAALTALESLTPKVAVLDVNLGGETSIPVARACAERGIPFVMATGYGATDEISAEVPGVPICTKPYTAEELREALQRALRGAGTADT